MGDYFSHSTLHKGIQENTGTRQLKELNMGGVNES